MCVLVPNQKFNLGYHTQKISSKLCKLAFCYESIPFVTFVLMATASVKKRHKNERKKFSRGNWM
jgi:hypothetical protein